MYRKKLIGAVFGAIVLLGGATVALAAPATFHFGVTPDVGPDYTNDVPVPPLDGTVSILGFDRITGAIRAVTLGASWNNDLDNLEVKHVQLNQVDGIQNYMFENDAAIAQLRTNLANATTTQAGFNTNVQGQLAFFVNLFNTMRNAGSTWAVSTSSMGFIIPSDKAKLDALSAPLAWSASSAARSIVTGTGATGFQVSSTRNASATYNVKVTTTASIAGAADGYVALEEAPTNSSNPSDWVEVGRCGASQALSLALVLQTVQSMTCPITADIPAGYATKLRSVVTSGTVSFAFVSGRETLK